jgi:(p)ppGpp synthase/HD superfamily hydrolase
MMTQLFSHALIFATTCHAEVGQLRKFTDEPYIVHPIDVAMRLKRFGVTDEVVLAAAVLHDVVEDTDATLDAVASLFGPDVARLVEQVTNPPGENFTGRLIRLGSADWQAQAIKCADIVSNCESLPALAPDWAATYLPKKAREVGVLTRAPVALWREADLATRLDRLVTG